MAIQYVQKIENEIKIKEEEIKKLAEVYTVTLFAIMDGIYTMENDICIIKMLSRMPFKRILQHNCTIELHY